MITEKVYAATVTYAPLKGEGKIGDVTGIDTPGKFTVLLSGVIGFLTVVGVIYFIIQVILAGYAWISAAGDANKLKEAQEKLVNSILGLFIILVAVVLINLLGYILGGIDFLNLEETIKNLAPK